MKEIRQIVIAPDSFKGTMEASQVCQIIQGSAVSYTHLTLPTKRIV